MSDLLTSNMNMSLLQAGQNMNDKTLARAAQHKNLEQIEQVAQEFEAVFVAEMLKPMFEGTQAPAPFNGGKGEEIFQGLLINEYGKMIAGTGSIGIADSIKAQLIKTQAENALNF